MCFTFVFDGIVVLFIISGSGETAMGLMACWRGGGVTDKDGNHVDCLLIYLYLDYDCMFNFIPQEFHLAAKACEPKAQLNILK